MNRFIMFAFLQVLAVMLTGFSLTAQAQVYYIRSGATGAGNGSDWNNAHPSIPAVLLRGATYYVADGTHGGYTFDDSGNTPITIKKATIADHGTSTGWQDSYGDGEAVFGRTVISADAIVLEGLVFDGDMSSYAQDGLINLSGGSDNCKILNCTLRLGCSGLLPSDEAYNIGIRLAGNNNTLISGTTIDGEKKSSMFLRDTGMIQLMGGTGNIVTNCVLKNGWDIDAFKTFGGFQIVDCVITNFANPKYSTHEHVDVIQAYFGSASGGVMERCFVWDFGGQLGNFDWYDSQNNYGFILRNNIFGNVSGTCFQGHPNFQWLNNVFYRVATIYDLGAIHLMNYNSGGNDHRYLGTVVRNNVFLECGSSGSRSISFDGSDTTTISHNYFGGSGFSAIGSQGTSGINGGNPGFVNLAARNFRLVAGSPLINAGTTVTVANDFDKNARPNGAYDIGAFEFGSSSGTGNQPPVVNAGSDLVVTLPTSSITLVGSASDPEGAPVTVGWSLITGPGTATFGAPASKTTTLTLSQTGAYTLRLTASDGTNTASDEVIVTLNPVPVPPTTSFEAESGTIIQPFSVAAGAVLQDLDTDISNGGRAVCTFTVPQAGNYLLVAYVNAPSASANSLFLQIDGEPVDPNHVWDIPVTTGFEKREVSWRGNGTSEANEFAPKQFTLSAGQHSLVIIGREADVALDRFEVYQSDPARPAAPSGLRVEN